jgi:serine phosphatase RsbU (regulator of sigma subunit)
MIFFKEAFKLSQELKNDSIMNMLYIHMGNMYESKGKLDSSILYYNRYYKNVKNRKDSSLLVIAYNNLGNAYYYKSEFSKALKYYQKAIVIFEIKKDSSNIGLSLHNIGLVHDDMGNTEIAETYYEKAKDIFINSNDSDLLATCYNSLASVYRTKSNLTKCLNYYFKSLQLFKNIGDSIGVCMVYANIGELKIDINEIDSAIYYLGKSADLAYKLNDWISLSGVYASISNLNLTQNKYYISIIYSNKSLIYAKLSSSLINQLEAYKLLKQANFSIRNYRDALLFSDSIMILKNSILGIGKTTAIELMESRYQAKNRKLEISNLQKEKKYSNELTEKQQQQMYFMLILIFLFIIFSIFIIRLLKNKQKTNKKLEISQINLTEKNEELNQLVEEVTVQRDEIDNQKQKIENIYTDLSESINYAQKIQNSIIPNPNLLKTHLTDIFTIFKPKDVVSGDFYWFTKINNNLIIAVSDCTGHGVPGAFMSMIGISFLREIIEKEKEYNPALILFRLREEVINSLSQTEEIGTQKDGMDISIININLDTFEINYAGANNPIYIITNSELRLFNSENNTIKLYDNSEFRIQNSKLLYEVKPDKMPIAIYTRMDNFSNKTIQLEKGDLIYMFSDGFADQFGGEKGKKLKYKAFKNLLLTNSSKNMDTQKTNIVNHLTEWQGSYNQIDDITLLGIKI